MDQKQQVAQAISDFALFLSGQRAPALVAQSLATVIQLDLTEVCRVIYNWATQNPSIPLPEAVLAARNKVFDIFFYRITRFEKIHSYFPTFEKALLVNCPFDDTREQLAELFRLHRWQDIRPIGHIRDQQQFMMELRKGITVHTEQFNEDIYKNTTFNLLSIDKYNFENEQVAGKVAGYQAKLKGIFNNFVDLMNDKQLKKDILIANEADRNAHHPKETFKIENYVLHMADLAIALFNDDFLHQSLQVFTVIQDVQHNHHLKLESFKKFQEKGNLLNHQKLEEYAGTRVGCHMVRQIIRLFTMFNPSLMLSQLQIEESRRVRRVLLKALECYGSEIHGLILSELSGKSHQVPWYYNRNMAYLLGRIVCSVEQYNNQAVDLLHTLWQPNTQRQLVLQIISTLGFIGNSSACEKLITRLKLLEPKYDDDSNTKEYCQKIVQALIAIESDKSLDAAIDFCVRQEILGQFKDKFSRIYLPEAFVQSCVGRIRKELQRIKLSFSLLGDKETARELLRIIAHMRTEPVLQLCRDIVKSISKKNPLAVDAEQILQDPTPSPLYSRDHTLQKLAMNKNLPEMICHISESNATGSLIVRTHNSAECVIEFERGEAVTADVKNYYVSNEDAFYWCFLLDSKDIQGAYFQPANPRTKVNMEITKPMEALISEGIAQRSLVYQISSSYLAPDSRFHRKQVSPIYTNFAHTEEPEKYARVWEALSETVDIDTLHFKTSLSKHDLYRILFYFIKRSMLEIEGQSDKQAVTGLEDGLRMLGLNLERIEKRPVLFNCYKASAEVCADLMRLNGDDVVQFTLGVLRKYYLESYNIRKVFGSAECQLCLQALALLSEYIKLGTSETRNELLNFLNFSFNVEDESLRPEEPVEVVSETLPITKLEKLENIDLVNDPLDDAVFGEEDFDDMLGALDTVLGSALGRETEIPNIDEGGQWAGLTESEEAMIRDLFDNIALAYVKPLKDFIRELYRNAEQQRPTSLEWYEMVEPVFTLLSGSSSRMGYQAIANEVKRMEQIVCEQKRLAEEQQRDSFLLEAVYPITEAYQKLCEMQPKTFALLISEEDLSDKKEVLIVKFILKQVPEMNDKLLSKILFAGLNSFDKFMQTRPDEIAALTGTSKNIAEDVMEKFYQYRKVYYKDAPDYWQNYIDLFELNLNLLREIQLDFENLALKAGDEEAAKALEKLKSDRQRTLWSLFILLCVREEYDLIEMIQQSVFEVRLQLLTDYYTNLLTSQTAVA